MAFKDARLAIRRSGIDLEDEFNIREFTSISQLEFAWDNLHLDEDEYGGAQEIVRHHFVTSAQPLSPTQPIHCFNRYRRAWFCYIVAQMNKLEYLVWAQEVKNCDWDENTINTAVYQGNLAMVRYCVENGCPMDSEACWFAAMEGHLDVLKYLHENDCPWDSDACSYAHRNNHDDCLNYLIEQKCEGFELFSHQQY